MLRTAFTTLPDVDCVLLALPADARPFAPLKETFEPLQRLSGGDAAEGGAPSVSACPRGLYLPDLLVRDARVEDHDDLVPVFNAQSEALTAELGLGSGSGLGSGLGLGLGLGCEGCLR